MPNLTAHRLEGSKAEVLDLIRRAALLVVKHHGQDGPSHLPYHRYAHHAGFLVVYYRCEPGVMARRDRGNWDTRPGRTADADQHVVDIRVGEHVAGLGWRGDGPIRTDRLRRGPWEFELLKAAGLGIALPAGSLRPATAAPEAGSRWVLGREPDHTAHAMRLSQPLTLTVVGYGNCYAAIAEPGADFLELRELLEDCYGASRTADGEVYREGSPTSCFSLKARTGRRLARSGRFTGRPDLRYFIGSDDGLSVASALLLAFDQENEIQRNSYSPIVHHSASPSHIPEPS